MKKKANHNVLTRSSWSGGWATIRDLEIVQTIVEVGSVTACAEKLGITQPAVSRALNQIEKRSGRTLFRRENNRLTPTSEVLFLYEEIKNIASSFIKLNNFQQSNDNKVLRIGAPPTLAYGFINEQTASFIKEKQHIAIHLEVIRTEKIIESVVNGAIDVGIADAFASDSRFQFNIMPLRKTQFICAIPKDHPLAQLETISCSDLHGINFIHYIKNNVARTIIDRTLNKNGCVPHLVAEVTDIQSALTFVNTGVGVSLVSAFPKLETSGIVYRHFKPEMTSKLIAFTKTAVNEAHVQSYINFISEHQPSGDEFSSPI